MTVNEEIKLDILAVTFQHAGETSTEAYAKLVEALYQWVKEPDKL